MTERLLLHQLKALRLRFRFFGRAEVRELRTILDESERIIECVYGFYQGGSGLLVATDKRLLLVDKRPFYLNLEDIRYEHLKEVVMSPAWLQATLQLKAGMRLLHFKSLSDARLRRIKDYASTKIEEAAQKIEQVLEKSPKQHLGRPYLNPAWRPHHTTLLPRRRPIKFYPLSSTVSLSSQ